ncbi:MAG TPA: excinuclease ABC subunit UvrC [Fimbriimonadaceae bacterium]|nr:excinuclease ABC subunit UvrC [Fimbriimonadaceae bacterium]HRJ96096.1 excinuclease ABC subunit UvrC [Fimbriimonadaceae bacterium]
MPPRSLPESVAERLKAVPAAPGCYLYRDQSGEVLYVGKALVLRSRVRSYFQGSTRHSDRIERMVRRVRDIEWIVVDSELEALVLECNLIKRYRPPFNVRLRDDKSYPYITITSEKFPRVLFTRKVRRDGAKYFGPYTSAWAVRDTLGLLHRIFPLIPCGKSWTGRDEQRPCLYYHIGQCLAPCAGLADREAYKEIVGKVERFLAGKQEGLLDEVRGMMNQAAENLEFERAAVLRDQIQALEAILQRQKVLSTDQGDRDVIAVVKDERGAAIQMLYVRGGKLIGQRQFYLDGSAETAPGEAVQEFVKQYYSEAPEVPREVLLPVEIAERVIVQQWLRNRRGGAVSLDVPKGGDKLRLIEMAATNAEQALETMRLELHAKEAWGEAAMAELAEALDLPTPPIRIEGYDISNIQGTAPVGSMVVVENGQPAKSEYRRFKIRYHPESPDDFAMMHEVLLRRLKAYADGDPKFAKLPDLIMVDGGKGQLGAALKARDELGLTVPMVGLAKRLELIFRPTGRDAEGGYEVEAVELPVNAPGLLLLRRLRDEAHRFALSFHRKIRDKRMIGSAIEEIPGIGPRRRRVLLRTFGSIDGIRRATVEEIAAVPTMTRRLAEQVREHLGAE